MKVKTFVSIGFIIGIAIALISITLYVVVSHAPSPNPVLTLKDSTHGTTVSLYQTGNKQDKGLLVYINERFDYSAKVPYEVFTEVVILPDNGDGITLQSNDGQYRFRASGGFAMSDDTLEISLKSAKQYVEENVDGGMVFEKKGDGWWELSWWNGPDKGGRRYMTNGELWCECEITWPGQLHNAPGEYDDLLELALESLALSVPASETPSNVQQGDKRL